MDKADEHGYRATYERCWVIALHELLGWPQERTRQWARRWADIDVGWLLHNGALHYIVPLLIPLALREPGRLCGENFIQFEGRIEHALDYGEDPSDPADELFALHGRLPPGEWMALYEKYLKRMVEKGLWLAPGRPELYDWQAAKRRVEAILAEYGERIPREGEPNAAAPLL